MVAGVGVDADVLDEVDVADQRTVQQRRDRPRAADDRPLRAVVLEIGLGAVVELTQRLGVLRVERQRLRQPDDGLLDAGLADACLVDLGLDAGVLALLKRPTTFGAGTGFSFAP